MLQEPVLWIQNIYMLCSSMSHLNSVLANPIKTLRLQSLYHAKSFFQHAEGKPLDLLLWHLIQVLGATSHHIPLHLRAMVT